jgi:Zn-dependent protease
VADVSRARQPSVSLRFSQRELLDLLVAWLALGVAFMVFFAGGANAVLGLVALGPGPLLTAFVVSLVTAGIGFLLHELGHKVAAVRFDNIAAFRADYGMLFVAVMSAFLGFLFAAPGAVHHRGPLSDRQHGLVALAGPAVNLVLAVIFVPLLVLGNVLSMELVTLVGGRGLAVNLFLAAFNLVPLGPLDGNTVLDWSKGVWVVVFLPTAVVAFLTVFVFRIGF